MYITERYKDTNISYKTYTRILISSNFIFALRFKRI